MKLNHRITKCVVFKAVDILGLLFSLVVTVSHIFLSSTTDWNTAMAANSMWVQKRAFVLLLATHKFLKYFKQTLRIHVTYLSFKRLISRWIFYVVFSMISVLLPVCKLIMFCYLKKSLPQVEGVIPFRVWIWTEFKLTVCLRETF